MHATLIAAPGNRRQQKYASYRSEDPGPLRWPTRERKGTVAHHPIARAGSVTGVPQVKNGSLEPVRLGAAQQPANRAGAAGHFILQIFMEQIVNR